MENIPDDRIAMQALDIRFRLTDAQIQDFKAGLDPEDRLFGMTTEEQADLTLTLGCQWLARYELAHGIRVPDEELVDWLHEALSALEAGGWDRIGHAAPGVKPAKHDADWFKERSDWIEERVNVMMPLVEHRPEIMKALKDLTVLSSRSQAVPRDKRQQALRQPVGFAHETLLGLCGAIAFEEYNDEKRKYPEHELLERINEDLGLEIAIIAENEGHGRSRSN